MASSSNPESGVKTLNFIVEEFEDFKVVGLISATSLLTMCPSNESRVVLCVNEQEQDILSKVDGGETEDKKRVENFFDRFLGCLLFKEVVEELTLLGKITCPIVVTSLLLHTRSIISMLFLGHLGNIELAGATLAMGFANITGYSVIKGISMGMEPICCQAYGAKRWPLLNQTFQRSFFLILLLTIPISLLWLYMETILLWLGQDHTIASMASIYIIYLVPDLLAQAHLQPLRVFLRTQSLTTPLTIVSTYSLILHIPINYFLVVMLNLGVKGVALASAWYSLNLNLGLVVYMALSRTALKPWGKAMSIFNLEGWQLLVTLAVPSVFSVCLEWWWYEVMLLLSGLLSNPETSVATMGILIQITGLIYVFPSSLSLGLSTRVGIELGSDQPFRASMAAKVGLAVAATCGLSAFGFTTSFRNILGKLFTCEQEVLRLTSTTLPILGFCELWNCPQTAACGVLRGSARPKIGAKINFVSFYGIGLPAAILMAFLIKIGFVGLWFGLVTAQCSCLGMMLYTLSCTDWKREAQRANELTYLTEVD